jgi:hypothetical protein
VQGAFFFLFNKKSYLHLSLNLTFQQKTSPLCWTCLRFTSIPTTSARLGIRWLALTPFVRFAA